MPGSEPGSGFRFIPGSGLNENGSETLSGRNCRKSSRGAVREGAAEEKQMSSSRAAAAEELQQRNRRSTSTRRRRSRINKTSSEGGACGRESTGGLVEGGSLDQ